MSRCLLIVDDEIDIRRLIIKKLHQEGFDHDILQASNPIEAYETFTRNKHRIDAIICDLYMPIQNGADLCALVKEQNPNIKIIIFTGDKRLNKTPKSLNADFVLFKPDDLDKIMPVLNKKPEN